MSRLFTSAALVAGAVLTIAALSAPAASAAPPPAAAPAAASNALGLPTLAAFQTSVWTADRTLRLTGDITGDGRADLVGFGDGGLWTAVAHADGTFATANRVMANFSFDQGWRVGVHPRWVTDITGDGRADVVGIGDAGVYTAVSNGDGTFGPITFAHLPTYGIANITTLTKFFAVDTNADGRTDLVSVGNDRRMFVATASGDGQFLSPRLVSNAFDFAGFDYGSFTMADVTGDHRAEVLAIHLVTPRGLVSSSPLADGTYGAPQIADAHFANGDFTTLHTLADVTGDGRADIVESDSTLPGTYVAVSRGDGTFTDFGSQASNGFGTNFGWNTGTTPRFAADLTADGRADLIGMGNDGVWTAVARTDATYDPSNLVFDDFGFNQGWRVGTNPIYLTDVNGDGLADIVGYGNAGVYVALSTGAGGFAAVGPANAVTVPSVVGLAPNQAGTRLTAVGLRLGTVTDNPTANCDNRDKVSRQTPAAGTLTTTGTAVDVTVDRLPKGQSCN